MDTIDAVPSVSLNDVNFTYSSARDASIKGCSLHLPRGSRCLLVGATGAGKTTLLQLIAGKYMLGKEAILVLGRPPFHDMVRGGQEGKGGLGW